MERNSPPVPDYSIRRGEISAYGRAQASSRRLQWLVLFVGSVIFCMLLILLAVQWHSATTAFIAVLLLTLIFLVVGLCIIFRYTNQNFIEPDLAFRKWLQQVCDGDLNARIGLDVSHRHHKELDFHTRNLASSLSTLSNDMDSLVESQTKKLNDQKRVLELLFKLTADSSTEGEDEVTCVAICQNLSDWFGGAPVECYLVGDTDQVLSRSAASVSDINGSQQPDSSTVEQMPPRIPSLKNVPSSVTYMDSTIDSAHTGFWVPFFAGEQIAGVLIIYIVGSSRIDQRETHQVLTTVSEQLSLSSSKKIALEQAHQARMLRDRSRLAAEIHDSLAQTLLAVRYQTTLLSEKLKSRNNVDYYQDVLKISGAIEEANEGVRGLIREYRNPLSEHRYAESLRVAIDRFSQASGLSVFFQSDDPQIRFTPREESVLQRIIGEALNNARKYAKANMIRAYLQCDRSGVRRILIEDDGIGFRKELVPANLSSQSKSGGEHIGLSIMQERAISIGAKLIVDTELGEGTRISIIMPPLIESRRESA